MDLTVDKKRGDICFNERTHTYFNAADPNKKYISVTTLIGKFEPPFDSDFWSSYKAMEKLVEPGLWRAAKGRLLSSKKCTEKDVEDYEVPMADFNAAKQDILDKWQEENLASTTRGTGIHADLEHSFHAQKTDISLQKFGIGGKFTCAEDDSPLDLDNGVYPELLVHYESPDGKLNVAGQIDLFVKEGNSFSILDWKTNKQIKTGSYFDQKTKKSEKLSYPLNDLDACNYSVYNMQLSTYAWMMRQLHPEWNCNELVLVHFDHEDNMTVYKMKYLEEQVEKMMSFWKKQSAVEENYRKRRRIEY